MLTFVLKRLLLAIPTLWFIASAIFMLGKLMPGTFGSAYLAQADPGYYSRGDAGARDRVYRQFLQATGQDLPLFYFSISSSVLPDTLYRVFPERDRQLLQKLALQYGNPETATNFYKSLKLLEGSVTAAQAKAIQPLLYTLYHHTEPAQIQAAVEGIAQLLPSPLFRRSQLQANAEALRSHSTDYAYLLPSVHWYGKNNQYHRWMVGLMQGNLGTSLRDGRPVAAVVRDAIGNTWWLLLSSMAVTTLLAMELALLMVRRAGGAWRKTILPGLFLLDSIPLFILAMLLLVLLASPAFLQLFPVYGMGYYAGSDQGLLPRISQWTQFMALPMLCLVLANLPYLTNQFYQAVDAVASQDYIRTARAKGLSETRVIRRHMLRNALLPVITLLSDFLPALVAGAVIIETVFAIPGVGRLLVDAVLARDYPVLVGIVVVIALFRLLAHLLSDILYTLADPRIKHSAA